MYCNHCKADVKYIAAALNAKVCSQCKTILASDHSMEKVGR